MSEIAEKILKFCLVHLSKRLQTSLSIATEMRFKKLCYSQSFFLGSHTYFYLFHSIEQENEVLNRLKVLIE